MTQIDLSWLLSAASFSLAMSATPGPNNAMVAASGATFGIRRTWWHMLGIAVGFPLMMIGVALGAGSVLERNPAIHEVMRWVGAAYMLWLAWHIASARPELGGGGGGRGRPLRFHEAALFQWINPKAWIIVVGALATYTKADGEHLLLQVLVLGVIFFVVCIPSVLLWAAIGAGVARFFKSLRAVQLFNWAMALLLVASLAPLFWEG